MVARVCGCGGSPEYLVDAAQSFHIVSEQGSEELHHSIVVARDTKIGDTCPHNLNSRRDNDILITICSTLKMISNFFIHYKKRKINKKQTYFNNLLARWE